MPDQPQRLQGVPEILRFWEQMRGAYVQLELEPLEIIKAPDGRVVTPLRQSARGERAASHSCSTTLFVWTVRQGRVRGMELFRHRADTLEAAGLRE